MRHLILIIVGFWLNSDYKVVQQHNTFEILTCGCWLFNDHWLQILKYMPTAEYASKWIFKTGQQAYLIAINQSITFVIRQHGP